VENQISKVSPGISSHFLVRLDCCCFAKTTQHRLLFSRPIRSGGVHVHVSSVSNEKSDTLQYVLALTTVEDYGIPVFDDGKHDVKKDALLKAKPILEQDRQTMLRAIGVRKITTGIWYES